jgi:hypothetical protein
VDVDCYKVVVNQPRVGVGDAAEFGGLAGREFFVGVEARSGGEEPLAAEDFVDAGEAAGEIVGGIEKGGVGVGQGSVAVEPGGVEPWASASAFHLGEEADGGVGPHTPLAEEAAVDVTGAASKGEGCEEVGEDVVVVAGVESDVVAAGFKDGADDVEGAVAVEGCDFDGDEAGDVGEGTPEAVGKYASTDGGLQVESDERNLPRDGPAVSQDFVFRLPSPSAETEEAGVITEA